MSLILVIGPHRSGTSAVTRLINLMGAEVGKTEELVGASEENPKGFWERADIIAANDRLLASMDCAWNKVGNWNPASVKPEAKAAYLAEIKSIFAKLPAGKPVVIKDPRLCLSLGVLLEAFPEAICVFTYRDPQEVAMSLNRRNGIPLEGGMAIWEAYSFHALMAAENSTKIFISYHELLGDKWGETQKLFQALERAGVKGLSMPMRMAVENFVDEKLHRSLAHVQMPEADELLQRAAKGEAIKLAGRLPEQTVQTFRILDWAIEQQAEKDALTGRLHEIAGALHVEGSPEAVLDQVKFMHGLVLERDQKLQEYNKYLLQFRENTARLQGQFQLLKRLVEETLESRSWKIGSGLTRIAGRFVGKRSESNSLLEAKKLLDGVSE